MQQEWFEMRGIRRRELNSAAWIPLRASYVVDSTGEHGYLGHRRDFYSTTSLAVPLERRAEAENLGWMDIGIGRDHSAYVENDRYHPSDVSENYDGDLIGIRLVLDQRGNREEPNQWHLHQDFVIAMRLRQEGNSWIAIDEGYLEVARIHYRQDGAPYLLEVRAEHLKDYLCARKMALYVVSHRSREEIVDNADHISWASSPVIEESNLSRWEGSVSEIHEGGEPYGSKWAVFHIVRTDVDVEEDVPTFGPPTGDNVAGESWTRGFTGTKLLRIHGVLWRREWVEPATLSPRIRGDDVPASVFFITDAEGTRENSDTLQEGGRWLWFRPEVIMALAHRRGGKLEWYTRDTGGVACSPDYDTHFGVNQLGFVNVYAEDIALLPEWQQRIWAGYNISPEGGVSAELLASQVDAEPASTQAPEAFLAVGYDLLNQASSAKWGFPIFRYHDQIPQLLIDAHRFRCVDQSGFYALAKDLARLTADSIDTDALQKIVPPPKGTKWASLKSLEHVLASKIGTEKARSLLGPLVGIYELRHADAHLASSEIHTALDLVAVDQSIPLVFQGYQLLRACVSALYGILDAIKKF